MKTKVAINGFGRIGRCAFKILMERSDIEVVAINDLTDTKTLAHLLKYDSNYGTYGKSVKAHEQGIKVGDHAIKVLAEKDPADLPWKEMNIDVVVESTGRFTDPEGANQHIKAGAKRVVISALGKGDDIHTVVLGANDEALNETGQLISNASCTTNCISPVVAVMEAEFGIAKAMMTTVHSYTASQALQDGPAKDLREARAAAENIVPTTTGAAIGTTLVVPSLKGKFNGMSIRVPTPVVSLSDITMVLNRDTTVEEVNKVLTRASKQPYYEGILGVTDEELVSSDFIGNSYSAVVDLKLTDVVDGNLVKVVAWYDNEWGYSNRLAEVVADVGKLIHKKSGTK